MGNMFVNFTNAIQDFYAGQPAGAAEDDALLAWICAQNALQQPVRITDLVRTGRFGTLPTLHRRLRLLAGAGFLTLVVGPDRRTRMVSVSPVGLARLDSRSSLLGEVAVG
ncbi:MAG: hypothetical protein FGM40_00035 [Rhodocyclaceae bacterium]|nr:hypothetical protein [Rhodocyclaceae bacterium]